MNAPAALAVKCPKCGRPHQLLARKGEGIVTTPSELIPLDHLAKYWQDGTPPPADPFDYRRYPIGPDRPGSENHGPLALASALLGAAARRLYTHMADLLDGVRYYTTEQRRIGHRACEFGGYVGFHVGSWAAILVALDMIRRDGGLVQSEIDGAYRLALGWWADEIATTRWLRTPDGQVMQLGARLSDSPHSTPETAAVIAQLIDPLPHGQLVPWLAQTVPVVGEGGPVPGIPWPWAPHNRVGMACLRGVKRARDLGLLEAARAAAEGRAVRTMVPVWRWDDEAGEHAAVPVVYGYSPRVWWSNWPQRQGRVEPVDAEPRDRQNTGGKAGPQGAGWPARERWPQIIATVHGGTEVTPAPLPEIPGATPAPAPPPEPVEPEPPGGEPNWTVAGRMIDDIDRAVTVLLWAERHEDKRVAIAKIDELLAIGAAGVPVVVGRLTRAKNALLGKL